jgi:hypothetical protein
MWVSPEGIFEEASFAWDPVFFENLGTLKLTSSTFASITPLIGDNQTLVLINISSYLFIVDKQTLIKQNINNFGFVVNTTLIENKSSIGWDILQINK